ncbi:MAG: DUF5683 domain-containing protein [Rikenellaceae bacterium]
MKTYSKLLKKILIIITLFCCAYGAQASSRFSLTADTLSTDSVKPYIRSSKYNDYEKAVLIVDSVKKSGIKLYKVSVDSLARVYFTDTLVVSGGQIPSYNVNGNIYATFRLDSLMGVARKEQAIQDKLDAKALSKLNHSRSDTIRLTPLTLLSIPVPGFSQIYNRQYWKLPVLYGAAAGFITGGVKFGHQYRYLKDKYDKAVMYHAPQEEIDRLNVDYMKAKNTSTMMYVGAAVTYLYFLCDGVWNYNMGAKDTQKATLLAVMLPGAGQIYNKAYWKLPILYGGFAALGYVIAYNGKGYTRFKAAYNALTDGNPSTVDEFNGAYAEDVLRNTRNNYRRYRDMAIFYTVGLYALSIVDAYVDASLNKYDISDNLSMRIDPMFDISNTTIANRGGGAPSGVAGLSMKLTF